MDGRDTPPASGEGYITKLERKMKEKGIGKLQVYLEDSSNG